MNLEHNFIAVAERVNLQIEKIRNPDQCIRTVATTMSAIVHERIHEKGLAADGTPIGKYSDRYYKYTRKKHGRLEPQDKKVFSLTRKMENSFTFGPDNPDPTKTTEGYGLGFVGSPGGSIGTYKDLSEALEKQAGKEVYKLTEEEKDQSINVALDFIRKPLNNNV